MRALPARWRRPGDPIRTPGSAGGSDGVVRVMKGDRVEIAVDGGDRTLVYDIVATRAGRRVEVSIARGVVEVVEVTRTGTPVRTARFLSSRVLALVEHPADGIAPG